MNDTTKQQELPE